jgi:hypothetical protein
MREREEETDIYNDDVSHIIWIYVKLCGHMHNI